MECIHRYEVFVVRMARGVIGSMRLRKGEVRTNKADEELGSRRKRFVSVGITTASRSSQLMGSSYSLSVVIEWAVKLQALAEAKASSDLRF